MDPQTYTCASRARPQAGKGIGEISSWRAKAPFVQAQFFADGGHRVAVSALLQDERLLGVRDFHAFMFSTPPSLGSYSRKL